jgi:DNA-binding transcriptional LysR family regulator
LSHIRVSAEEIRNRGQSGHVTLATSTSFASFWMVPRLQSFREDLPAIDLRIQTADRDLSLELEGIPLGIRGGSPDEWPDHECRKIADEVIMPVASPKYLAENPDIQSSSDAISKCRLIHLEEPSRPAATWGEWLRSAGVANPKTSGGLRINDYVLVIQAAMEGQGIALGWQHLVQRALDSELLIEVGSHQMRTGKAFHVVWPRNTPLSPAAASVRDWLVAQGAAD